MESCCTSSWYHQSFLHKNQQKFGQAQATPFTQDPLSSLFGYDANANFIQEMLQNQEQSVDLNTASDRFISYAP